MRPPEGGQANLSAASQPAGESPQPVSTNQLIFAATLALAVFLTYQPAWFGGFIWDDAAHVTRPELRSAQGLYRIWFDLRATQQYYPLVHSVFWLEHKLWGDSTLGYHLVNIALHVAAALLAASLLRRLAVPGAWLAAAIFALHPVNVESVAWITELKNTLSAVFYLGAAIAYIHFDRTRKARWHLTALGLFGLGLLSKTVVATMPAALLVVFWWKRGRLDWRRDVRPLLPFFLIGAGAGVFTAWVERKLIGAEGAEFKFTLIERFLIAGRVIWFYLHQLFWPANLVFIYPRWRIDQADWWQYLYPAATLLVLAALWRLRRQTRAPLATALLFVGTLFPVLGFLNVFPFIYSFVADHFQYLASLSIIAFVSSGLALLLKRATGAWRLAGQLGCLALLAGLAVLSWRQSRMYTDIDTLYLTTIERNPDCSMAHYNLGQRLLERGEVDEAIKHYREAVRIKADDAEAYNGLGLADANRGYVDEAIENYHNALRFRPRYAEAHNNLGTALLDRQQVDEAIRQFEAALEIAPDYAQAHNNLGHALTIHGRTKQAIEQAIYHCRRALKIMPEYAEAHLNLGNALVGAGKTDEAVDEYHKALKIKPFYVDAHFNLGQVLAQGGKFDDSVSHFRQALEIRPNYVEAHISLGFALSQLKRDDEALMRYQDALRLAEDHNDMESVDRIRKLIGELPR